MEQYISKSALVAEIERRIKYDEMVMDHDAQITELLSRELNTLYELLSFIKSFKAKEVTWKPSEEQLNALDEVYKTHGANNVCRRVIFNLLEQLKKLSLLALAVVILAGCSISSETNHLQKEKDADIKERWHGFHVEIIDSCEYILRYTERTNNHQGFGQSFMAHKGNCKYCAERRKQELLNNKK